jgi:Spy/CpxP family protein refolding chaperone
MMHLKKCHWRRARRLFGKCGGFHVHEEHGHDWHEPGAEALERGGGFGVRRPFRFLAHKLGLDETQMAALARILDELKTERAQGEVDRRRTVAAFADAVSGEQFDAAKAAEGGDLRVASADRLRGAVLKALQEIHAVLSPEQRSRLALLIRTGTLTI